MEYLNYFGSIITNGGRCMRKMTSRIDVGKIAFYRKKSFPQQIGLKIKAETSKMLCLKHSFVWC
jgi:hypothetical protein